MSDAQVRPGSWIYILALVFLIIAAGLALYGGTFFTSVLEDAQHMLQMPGDEPLELAHNGTFMFQAPTKAADDELTFTLRPADGGEPIAVMDLEAYASVSSGGNATQIQQLQKPGMEPFFFKIEQPGAYTLTGAYESGAAEPEFDVLLLRTPIERMAFQMLSLCGSVLFLGVGLIIGLIGLIMRSSSTRRIRQQGQAQV